MLIFYRETFGCAIKARFALKAEMKFRPYQIVSWAVIVSVVILGFALRNAEMYNYLTLNQILI